MILPDEFGDWRIEIATRIAGGQVLPGGLATGDGLVGWKTTVTTSRWHGGVSFPTPSPVALPLNISIDAAMHARLAVTKLEFPKAMSDGTRSVEGNEVGSLYQYFERGMVAAVFAFQALEAFCNQSIDRITSEPLEIRRGKKFREFEAHELERKLSTEEKLFEVLPKLFESAPLEAQLSDGFRLLKEIRDDLVHLKSKSQYIRGRPDTESVYYRLLNVDPLDFPQSATSTMRHFVETGDERWLDAAEAFLKAVRESA